MEAKLSEFNEQAKGAAMNLVLFRDAIEHCCKIYRILCMPKGNALLVGVGGSGRHSMTKLASYIASYTCFQIEITKDYKVPQWKDDLKRLYSKAGVKGQPMSFLFSDTEIVKEVGPI